VKSAGRIGIQYGTDTLSVDLPVSCDVKGMRPVPALADPAAAILRSYRRPIGTASLGELASRTLSADPGSRAVVVVSDNTRPVPYRGRQGILPPLLRSLIQAGFSQERISVLVGRGSHRPMTDAEVEAMLGLRESGFRTPMVQHDYEDAKNLLNVGRTARGSPVEINRLYVEAELKIVTGLVESHFMAGASGGRKAICPAIAGKRTLRVFHGPEVLASPLAADLVLDGNPCNEEAEQAAGLAGCDFCVNVTIDAERRITGVFSGELFASHRRAVEKIREYVTVELDRRYDLVLVPAGFVGVNHYQGAKAAVEASRAVKPGGGIVVIARHRDPDPIGSAEYRKTLAMLKQDGPERFLRAITSPHWSFLHDQWQTQMWGKVLKAVGPEGKLVYCCLEIPETGYAILPGVSGYEFLSGVGQSGPRGRLETMQAMVQSAAVSLLRERRRRTAWRQRAGREPEALLLEDGPYGVPQVSRTG
jgi:nickel-dependent lactate racemase